MGRYIEYDPNRHSKELTLHQAVIYFSCELEIRYVRRYALVSRKNTLYKYIKCILGPLIRSDERITSTHCAFLYKFTGVWQIKGLIAR